MRKWGIVISLFYALVIVGLLTPAMVALAEGKAEVSQSFLGDVIGIFGTWIFWVPVAALLCGQALLLFLSVDTSQKRLKPRAHIMVSYSVTAMLFGLMTFAALSCLGAAWSADDFFDKYWSSALAAIGEWAALWLLWGIVFYFYFRNSSAVTTRAVTWLLRGSVLELLIAVPCHVIVRRRHDCSAPIATSFGITTGVAVMLLAFGPSVLLLYKKRLDGYAARASTSRA